MAHAYRLEDGEPMETRIALLEQTCSTICQTLIRLENKIDKLDHKMDAGFSQLNGRIWANFYWGISGFAGVLGLLAHVMKWI